MKKKRFKLYAWIYLALCMVLSGCAHGPVRYKTLGYHKYATVEFTRRSPKLVKPLAAPVGVVCDTVVTAIDIPVILIGSIPMVFTRGGPDGAGCMNEPWIGVLTFPFWYPVQMWVTTVWPEEMYEEVFGRETGIFKTIETEKTAEPEN